MQFFSQITIFISAFIGFIFGALWYSPLLFMNAWLTGQGITKKDMPKRSKIYMLQINLYSFIAHSAIAGVLALMFELLQITTLKVAIALGVLLTLAFVVTTHYIDMIYTTEETHWSKKAQIKFLVNSGYYVCVTAIMSASLFYFAIN